MGSTFKAMKSLFKPWIFAGALLMCAPLYTAHAQETLAGVGAAGAMGATLGAAGAGGLSSGRITRGVNNGSGSSTDMEGGDPRSSGGDPRGGGSSTDTTTVTTTTTSAVTPPPVQTFHGTGEDYVRELLSVRAATLPAPGSRRLSPRAQARYAAKVARQTKKQRSRAVQAKYKIPGIGWEAAYLPQDRYKFGKIWRFVSTEDDRFYYTPSGMARKRFNPNRVLGFNSFQDALAAGYRPDPATRPAPGAQVADLARLYRGPALYTFVEYLYAGQISPQAFLGTYNYAHSVERTLRPTRAAPYIGSTVAKILEAALTGDQSIIPTQFNSNGPIAPPPPVTAGADGRGESGDPRMSGGSGSGDPRMSGGSGSSSPSHATGSP